MTQLFDTEAFADTSENTNESTGTAGRHLRSLPTWGAEQDLTDRSSQWRLDDDTIETARRGIALARQALSDAAKDSKKPNRKAA